MNTYREVFTDEYTETRLHMMNGTLSVKYNGDNTVARFKYRFYVSGFWDKQGVDYQGSPWSAMPSASTLKMVEAIALQLGLFIFRTDVVCCFNQNKPIERTVVCRLPKGLRKSVQGREKAWRLLVALNGLPEATREWQQTFEQWLLVDLRDRSEEESERRRKAGLPQTRFYFVASHYEESLYVARLEQGNFVITRIVDDVSGYVTTEKMWKEFHQLYKNRFRITGGEKEFKEGMYNGAHVTYDREGGTLEYRLHSSIDRLLASVAADFGELNVSGVPMIPGAHNQITVADCPTTPEEIKHCDSFRKRYRTIVMTILWMVNYAPELSFAASFLSRFLQNPGVKMWGAVKVLLGYLKGRRKRPLIFRRTFGATAVRLRVHLPSRSRVEISTSADAAQQGDQDGVATIGYIIKVNDCVIVSRTMKLKRVTIGINEAELYAQTETARHMMALRLLCAELGFRQVDPTPMFCDSRGAVAVAQRRAPTHRTAHINRHFMFIRQVEQDGGGKLIWLNGKLLEADINTKALVGPHFKLIRDQLLDGAPLRG